MGFVMELECGIDGFVDHFEFFLIYTLIYPISVFGWYKHYLYMANVSIHDSFGFGGEVCSLYEKVFASKCTIKFQLIFSFLVELNNHIP